MNRISHLVKGIYPHNVHYQELSQLCEVQNGFAFDSRLFNSDAIGLPLVRVRDINTGFAGIYYSGSYDEKFVVENGDLLIGMDGDFRAVRWRNGRALLNQRVCRVRNFRAEVLPGYVYYIIQIDLNRIQEATQESTVKHLSSRQLERVRIPVPPLPVQEEIVQILDLYQALEAALASELSAELTARRQQYAVYRDLLLMFPESEGVRWLPMGQIGEFIRGRRFTKDDYADNGVPAIHYGDIYTRYGIAATLTVSHVRRDMTAQLRYAAPGDVVFAGVGETVEDVGKSVAWLGNADAAIHDDCFRFSSGLNPKFVAYYAQTKAFNAEKAKYVARAKVKRLSSENLAKIAIPVPPAEEQERVVAILDRLSALVDELAAALPAEIGARRAQYEHYRDRLLTFEEKAP